MRRLQKITITAVVVLIGIFANATNTTKTVYLNYSINDFNIYQVGGLTYIDSYKHILEYGTDSLLPAIPKISVQVVLGPNQAVRQVSIDGDTTLLCQNVHLVPCHKPKTTDESGIVQRSNIPQYTCSYPDSLVENMGTSSINGIQVLHFNVWPFRYDYTDNSLHFIDNLHVTIELEDQSGNLNQAPVTNQLNMSDFLNLVEQRVINPDDVSTLYPVSQQSSSDSSDYEYLIITINKLASEFQRLADWKTRKGIRAKVLTMEDIVQTYDGIDPAMQVKNALIDYYSGTYKGLKYVLLGGTNFVPSVYCPIIAQGLERRAPTDWYYACLKDINWDKNGNGVHGEVEDSVDIEPSLVITRVGVDSINVSNTTNFVDKILEYEINPPTEHWVDNILMGGLAVDTAKTIMVNGRLQSDVERAGEITYQYIRNYWQGGRTQIYDTNYDSPYGGFYPDSLQRAMCGGHTFADINTHGGFGHWRTLSSNSNFGQYDIEKAKDLNNSGFSLIVTGACNTAAYDVANLATAFMVSKSGGIVAYLGTTRENWGDFNYLFNRHFYMYLFKNKWHRFGEAVYQTKVSRTRSCSQYNYHRWQLFAYCPQGDPETPIYINRPENLTNIIVQVNDSIVSVQANTSECNICLTSLSDYGNRYFRVFKNVSDCAFANVPDSLFLCITKPGYKPFTARIYKTAYIQNQDLQDDTRIIAQKVLIGRDVTDAKQHGPVTVSSGSTTISSKDGVLIKNNFSVNKGASFTIEKPD